MYTRVPAGILVLSPAKPKTTKLVFAAFYSTLRSDSKNRLRRSQNNVWNYIQVDQLDAVSVNEHNKALTYCVGIVQRSH